MSTLAEVKEYNFLGNIIDNKGRFKRSAQELSKKGIKAFFSDDRHCRGETTHRQNKLWQFIANIMIYIKIYIIQI
jgi:hypothetical protein